LFVVNDYQVDSLVSEEFVPSLVMSTGPPKWLNIILDINGILCHCMEKKATNRMPFVNSVQQRIHSSTVPTIVGPKAVFTQPGLLEFLTTISKFTAHVFIWSSMKRTVVEEIVHYLFCGLPQPFEILGQDSCRKIEISKGKYLKVIGGSKEIFLSNLSEALFIGSIHLDEEDTILIDDSPEKCVCNDSGNCLFLETWTPLDVADDFLHTLGLWLLRLHTNYTRGQLRDFVNRNRGHQIRLRDVASAALDFSKENVEDGIVDSPPSRTTDRTSVCSPSPLRDCQLTPIRQCSRLPMHQNIRTPQRQLYCEASLCNKEEDKEKDPVNYSVKVPGESGLASPASQSQAAMRPRHLDKEGRLLRTQSLSSQPYPWYSSRELLLVGRTAYSDRRQSYPEPSLCSLIRQCRERECASSGITCPKAYSYRDEILRGMAKLKLGEIGTNAVFIKMRHFSDFETCSHILQVQFFPPKIQF
jgi:hypothetical protein